MGDMNRKYIAVFLALFIFPPTFSQSVPVTVTYAKRERKLDPKLQGKPERKLEEMEHRLSDAFVTNDAAVLKALLADDLESMGMISPNTKDWFIALAQASDKDRNDFKIASIEKFEMRIRIYGDTGIVIGREETVYTKENGARSSIFNFMNVWVRKDGKWQCVAMSADSKL